MKVAVPIYYIYIYNYLVLLFTAEGGGDFPNIPWSQENTRLIGAPFVAVGEVIRNKPSNEMQIKSQARRGRGSGLICNIRTSFKNNF